LPCSVHIPQWGLINAKSNTWHCFAEMSKSYEVVRVLTKWMDDFLPLNTLNPLYLWIMWL
jgi:hypothetical protein